MIMGRNVYEECRKFLRKYPLTIAWRIKQHSSVVQEHLNDDEVLLYTFVGQKDTKWTLPFYTTVIAFTNKRMLLGRKRFFGRYFYTSITPDMLNDFEIKTNIVFGTVEIDTVKEHFMVGCLNKKSLPSIEDALSKYLVDEKLKYLNGDKKAN